MRKQALLNFADRAKVHPCFETCFRDVASDHSGTSRSQVREQARLMFVPTAASHTDALVTPLHAPRYHAYLYRTSLVKRLQTDSPIQNALLYGRLAPPLAGAPASPPHVRPDRGLRGPAGAARLGLGAARLRTPSPISMDGGGESSSTDSLLL